MMPINWKGKAVKDRVLRAQIRGVDTTMAAAVLHAKQNHGPGAHGAGRFQTRTGSLERSIRIADKAKRIVGGAEGRWGSTETVYARRIELGFQGKDKLGRIYDQPAFPFLVPAAQAEYPKLASRIRRAMA